MLRNLKVDLLDDKKEIRSEKGKVSGMGLYLVITMMGEL